MGTERRVEGIKGIRNSQSQVELKSRGMRNDGVAIISAGYSTLLYPTYAYTHTSADTDSVLVLTTMRILEPRVHSNAPRFYSRSRNVLWTIYIWQSELDQLNTKRS